MRNTYRPEYLPSIQEIRDSFTDEITSLGGIVPDAFDDGRRLLMRAVLTANAAVRPGDIVTAGVAVRAAGAEIEVYPYTFRLRCTNGAIAAHALPSRRLERIESTGVFVPTYDVAVTVADFCDAVRACAAPEVFATVADEMRSAAHTEADIALQLLPSLRQLPRDMAAYAQQILERFAAGGDQSAFGLMNAVTSVARDTADVEIRWKLEQLGGSLPGRLARQRWSTTAAAGV